VPGTGVYRDNISTVESNVSNRSPAFLSRARVVVGMLLLLAVSCDALAQNWRLSLTSQPPAHAAVGDVIGVTMQISVDAGIDDLTINAISSGATTGGISGFDTLTQLGVIPAGESANVMCTAVVVAPPGSAGVQLQIEVDGTYGATNTIRSVTTNSIVVLEGVAASLSVGAPRGVRRGATIAYGLDLVNSSDTEAEVAVPNAGFAAPTGTTPVVRNAGSTTLSAGSATHYGLVVFVSDSNNDGDVITMQPTGVTYAMSQIGLTNRAPTITPASVSSIVVVPLFADGFE